MFRSYKFRLYPNNTQEQQLDFLLWQGRKIYNGALEMWEECCEFNGCDPSLYDLRDYWCAQRKVEIETFGLLPAATVDDLIRRLKKSFTNAYKRVERNEFTLRQDGTKNYGFPQFKSRWKFKSLGYIPGSGCKFWITNGRWGKLRVMNCGELRVRVHRALPDNAKVKIIMITREQQDKWYATLQCEMPDIEIVPNDGPAIGIDIGLVFALALSDGTTVECPKWYQDGRKRLRIIQRKLDRQRRANNPQNYNEDGTVKRGVFIWYKSTRMKETERLLRRVHKEFAEQRWYFWHTITDWLTKEYELIALEDLSPDFMLKNHRLAMHASNAAFGQFRLLLDYKAEERGVELRYVNPAYTSQTCPECGVVSADNRKTQATFRCVSCGYTENADINAARNILNAALEGAVPALRGEIKADRSRMPCEAQLDDSVATNVITNRAV